MSANQFLKSLDRNVSNVSTRDLREQHQQRTDITDITEGRENFINTFLPSAPSQLVDSFLSQQLRFIESDVSLMSRSQFGDAGEQWAYAEFERAGYMVTRTGKRDAQGDLRVVDADTGELWRVEVKSARRDKRGQWQVCLKRQVKARVCTDVAHSHMVLILAFPKVGAPIPFLIPVDDLRGLKLVSIPKDPRTYAGKWSKYRQLDGLKMPEIEREV